MPVNFSNLVLRPCMNTFAVKLMVDPIESRPGQPPYEARAILTSRDTDVQSMDGAVFSDQKTTFGLRFDDFDGPAPRARDELNVTDPMLVAHGISGRYIVDDVDLDAQGGAVLKIRKVSPDYPP